VVLVFKNLPYESGSLILFEWRIAGPDSEGSAGVCIWSDGNAAPFAVRDEAFGKSLVLAFGNVRSRIHTLHAFTYEVTRMAYGGRQYSGSGLDPIELGTIEAKTPKRAQ